jgi:hypothetical protein
MAALRMVATAAVATDAMGSAAAAAVWARVALMVRNPVDRQAGPRVTKGVRLIRPLTVSAANQAATQERLRERPQVLPAVPLLLNRARRRIAKAAHVAAAKVRARAAADTATGKETSRKTGRVARTHDRVRHQHESVAHIHSPASSNHSADGWAVARGHRGLSRVARLRSSAG